MSTKTAVIGLFLVIVVVGAFVTYRFSEEVNFTPIAKTKLTDSGGQINLPKGSYDHAIRSKDGAVLEIWANGVLLNRTTVMSGVPTPLNLPSTLMYKDILRQDLQVKIIAKSKSTVIRPPYRIDYYISNADCIKAEQQVKFWGQDAD